MMLAWFIVVTFSTLFYSVFKTKKASSEGKIQDLPSHPPRTVLKQSTYLAVHLKLSLHAVNILIISAERKGATALQSAAKMLSKNT